MTKYTSQDYWDQGYKNLDLKIKEDALFFKAIFKKYLANGGRCFEVGCYPGQYLIYLGKMFDYEINGIDTTPHVLTRLPEFANLSKVKVGEFFQDNFLTYQSDQQYDVVCSFGFIEHFDNYLEIIDKHIDLVKPGGILIISCPNFRKFQWIYHAMIDPVNLKRHNIRSMAPEQWAQHAENRGMYTLLSGYDGDPQFWYDTPRPWLPLAFINIVTALLGKTFSLFSNKPSRWYSPMAIYVGRRSEKD